MEDHSGTRPLYPQFPDGADFQVLMNIDEYHAHFDTFDSTESIFKKIPTTRNMTNINQQTLHFSYYMQQRSSFIVVPNEAGFSPKAKEYIRQAREYTGWQAYCLSKLSEKTGTIFVPEWWDILYKRLLAHNRSDVQQATRLANFEFSQDLSVLAQFEDRIGSPSILISLISRSFFQNLLGSLCSMFVSHCNDCFFNIDLVSKQWTESLNLSLYSHCVFLANQNPGDASISLLVSHPTTKDASLLTFKAAQHAVNFIVLHELAHLALHSGSSFSNLNDCNLFHSFVYSFPDFEILKQHLIDWNDDVSNEDKVEDIDQLAGNLCNKTVESGFFVKSLSNFETSILSPNEIHEIEADSWAFQRALEMLEENTLVKNRLDNIDLDTFNAFVIGTYSTLLLIGLITFTDLYVTKKSSELNISVPAIYRIVSIRIERLKRHLANQLKDRYFYPEPIKVLDHITEKFRSWLQESLASGVIMNTSQNVHLINSFPVAVRLETLNAASTDALTKAIIDNNHILNADGHTITFTQESRQKGFGLGEVHDFLAMFRSVDSREIFVSVVSSFLYEVAKSTCKRIYISGKSILINKSDLEAALNEETKKYKLGAEQSMVETQKDHKS